MLVVRFKVQCQPERTEELVAAFVAMIEPTRALPGALHFDVARDLSDPNALIVTEVFENRAARTAATQQPEAAGVTRILQDGALVAPPEWTLYEIASAESPSGAA